MVENRGGKRKGAGRKSKKKLFASLSVAKKRKALLKFVDEDKLEKIIKSLVKSALTNSSDRKYLLDQVMGRSLQTTDITSGGEKLESFSDEQVSRIADRVTKRRASDGGSDSPEASN